MASGFAEIEAAFDAAEPFFRAIGAHRDIGIMAGFGGCEVGDADCQRGETLFRRDAGPGALLPAGPGQRPGFFFPAQRGIRFEGFLLVP